MAIHVFCECGKRFVLDDVHLGRRMRCKGCGRRHVLEPTPAAPRSRTLQAALVGVLIGLLIVAGAAAAYYQVWPARARATAPPSAPSSAPEKSAAVKPADKDTEEDAALPCPQTAGGTLVDGRIDIDTTGDARFTIAIRLPAADYTVVKAGSPNLALLLRRTGLCGNKWLEPHEVTGNFDDTKNTITLRCGLRGMARMVNTPDWTVPVANMEGWRPVAVGKRAVHFSMVRSLPEGMVTGVWSVHLPRGSEKVRVLSGPLRISFQMPSGTERSDAPTGVQLNVDAREYLLACLGKSYGDTRFPELWLARAVFRNTGGRSVTDYRVRFRLADFADEWSPWMNTARIVPGQTVTDAYFPNLSIEKIAQLESARHTVLHIEARYRRPDGQEVGETTTRAIRILGRNEAIYSDLRPDARIGFADQFNLAPLVLASFVSHHDPIIQKVAGKLSGTAGGGSTSLDPRAAEAFLQATFEFMAANLTYQTPPGMPVSGTFVQHVKYGRDVLRNRAGTCVDLAILYASVCSAVGLRPVLYVVPGHCFPAVKFGDKVLAIESTAIGKAPFAEAVKVGMETLKKSQERNTVLEIDVQQMHARGIQALDLPAMGENVLTEWGIRFPRPTPEPSARPAPPARPSTQTRPGSEAPKAEPKFAVWSAPVRAGGESKVLLLILAEDGTYARGLADPDGRNAKMTQKGRYTLKADELSFESTTGRTERGKVQRTSDKEMVYTITHSSRSPANVGARLVFTRVK